MPHNKKINGEIGLLLRMLDDAFDGKAWHGPSLRSTVSRVTLDEALWRPGPRRKCIAEIAVHAAYWKYAARRRLRGDERGSFPLKGSDWFKLPAEMSERTWREYRAMLDEKHRMLRETVAALPPSRLSVVPKGSRVDNGKLIYGVAAHDVYHAGQIRLIRAM